MRVSECVCVRVSALDVPPGCNHWPASPKSPDGHAAHAPLRQKDLRPGEIPGNKHVCRVAGVTHGQFRFSSQWQTSGGPKQAFPL